MAKNSRKKGAGYELAVGKKFRVWAEEHLKSRGLDPKDWFKRTPLSGGWSRKHSPGEDLIIPDCFTPAIECKKREQWTFSSLLKGEAGPNQVWGFWDESVKKVGERPLFLVFSKNFEADWLLMRLRTMHKIIGQSEQDESLERRYHVLVRPVPDEMGGPCQTFALIRLDHFLEFAKPEDCDLGPEKPVGPTPTLDEVVRLLS